MIGILNCLKQNQKTHFQNQQTPLLNEQSPMQKPTIIIRIDARWRAKYSFRFTLVCYQILYMPPAVMYFSMFLKDWLFVLY